MLQPLHRRLLGRPGLLLCSAVGGALAAHNQGTTPLSGDVYYYLAFVAVLAGSALGVLAGREDAWFFLQLGWAKRPMWEFLQILAWAATPAIAFALVTSWSMEPLAPVRPGPGAIALLVSSIHVASIGFLLLCSPLPNRLLPLALVALAWWIPALIPAFVGLLDASPMLAPSLAGPDTWAALLPVGALIPAALLLPRPRGPIQ